VLNSIAACDSLVNLSLTVLQPDTTFITDSICQGGVYNIGSNQYITTGVYTVNYSNIFGCDSTVILDLTVVNTLNTVLNETICFGGSFQVGSMVFSQTGSFTTILTSFYGCDSIVTLNLFEQSVLQSQLSDTICDSEPGIQLSVGGPVYDTSGVYTEVLTASNGCDSTVSLFLTVLPAAKASFSWVFTTYPTISFTNLSTDASSYTWDFGDGSPLNTNIHPFHGYQAPGTYVVTLNAFNGQCGSDSYTDTVVVNPPTSLPSIFQEVIFDLYPNPNDGEFFYQIEGLQSEELQVEIFDATGRLIYMEEKPVAALRPKNRIDLGNVARGIYMFRLEVEGQYITKRVIVH
jgi:hypothetical protein